MKFLIMLVVVALAGHIVDCQVNIGLPPPPEDTPEGRGNFGDGIRKYPSLPVVQQPQEKMSADEQDFDDENSIEERKPCFPTELCTLAGGYCVKKAKNCNGTVDARGCRGGKKCKCCIPEQAECVDHYEECKGWADGGECYINPMFMMVYCKLSCNACVDCPCGCGPGTCTGPNKCDCTSPYEQVGYTCLNPANFNRCLNYNIHCDGWVAGGVSCDSTALQIFCKKACNLEPCV